MAASQCPYVKVRVTSQERQVWYELAQARQLTFSRFVRSLMEREASRPPQYSPKVCLQRRRDLARCLTWLKSEVAANGQGKVAEILDQAFALLSEIEQEVTQ